MGAKNLQSKINIACSSNDKYAPHLGVMVLSLLENCSSPRKVEIFVADGGISEENKRKINGVVKNYDSRIQYLKPKDKYLSALPVRGYFGIEVYYRFFLIDNVKVDKLLYLDVDLIVESDIAELYKLDFKNKLVLAAEDIGVSSKKKRTLRISESKSYFNSGVLLINCVKWRRSDTTKKLVDIINKNPELMQYVDQDALNMVLCDNWGKIGLSWNFQAKWIYSKSSIESKGKKYNGFLDAMENPKIIHYAGFLKPWFSLDVIPCKGNYFHYVSKSPWSDEFDSRSKVKESVKRFGDYIKFMFTELPDLIRTS